MWLFPASDSFGDCYLQDFGPLCDLLNEGRYAHVDALLTDFSRACDAVAVVRINDFKK
jgi:hypothetical protein